MDLDSLADRLEGDVLSSDHAGYEEARRVWNGMIDRNPAIIARCRSPEDVAAAVAFAREAGLPLAVRGGGHNVAGLAVADGAMVLDLSPISRLQVDPEHRTARAGGGARLADVDEATQEHGLATSLGVVSRTGIAGLTLSGGIGWLRRKHGMSCDNLVSAEVVTADSGRVTASAEEHPDLFWALRGGGGNFGVVTSFEYRVHPVGPEVSMAFVLYPGERAGEILRRYEEYMAQAPDEVGPLAFLGRVPAAEAFPEDAHGRPYAAIVAMFVGPPDEGERILRPLRELGRPIVDLSGRMPYVEAQRLLDEDYPDGWRYYWKSIGLRELSDDVIDRLVAGAEAAPSGHSTLDVWYHGGAMSRVGPAETAYGDRSALFLIAPEANWEDPSDDEVNIDWGREVIAEMRPYSDGGAYLNFPGFLEEGDRLVREAFGQNYERLAEVKKRYDPTNLFRLNQNIRPTP
jgi:FAD/FMN-containing dehydrogenase